MSAEQIKPQVTSEEQDTCYLCYEEQLEENKFLDPNPCNCRGTIKIHNTCFNTLTTIYDSCCICMTKFPQNGYKKYYYPSGTLEVEGLLVNGLKTGLWKIWYRNGQLMWEENYINGKMNGLYQSWHENGQLMVTVNYINGKMN
jgi:hypothetical protein